MLKGMEPEIYGLGSHIRPSFTEALSTKIEGTGTVDKNSDEPREKTNELKTTSQNFYVRKFLKEYCLLLNRVL